MSSVGLCVYGRIHPDGGLLTFCYIFYPEVLTLMFILLVEGWNLLYLPTSKMPNILTVGVAGYSAESELPAALILESVS